MNAIQNERLKAYYEAEKAVLSGQSYTIGNRTLTRASLAEIRVAIDQLIAAGATRDPTEVVPEFSGKSRRIVFHD